MEQNFVIIYRIAKWNLPNCMQKIWYGIPLGKILDKPLPKMPHDGRGLDAELARWPSPLSPCEGNIFTVQQRI